MEKLNALIPGGRRCRAHCLGIRCVPLVQLGVRFISRDAHLVSARIR